MLITSVSFQKSHKHHVEQGQHVLRLLHNAGATAKTNKREFFAEIIIYIRYTIRPFNFELAQHTKGSVTKLKHHTNQTKHRSFPGLSNFNGQFVSNFACCVFPLNIEFSMKKPNIFGRVEQKTSVLVASWKDARITGQTSETENRK